MSTIDQQFVEYIVKTLVNNPDKVNIERAIDEKGVLLSLSVDPEDVGRVIGRRGAGTKNDARYNLKIVNTDENGSFETTGEPVAARTVEDYEEESEDSTLTKNTRAELADLDDLDI